MLLAIKEFLEKKKEATIEELVAHFHTTESFMLVMLDELSQRGVLEKKECEGLHCLGCYYKSSCMNKKKFVFRLIVQSWLLCVMFFSSAFFASAEETFDEKRTRQGKEKEIFYNLNEWFKNDKYQFGFLFETEWNYSRVKEYSTGRHKGSGDLSVSDVQLYLDTSLYEGFATHFLLEYSDDELYLDELFFAWEGTSQVPINTVFGYQYLPFGNYDSAYITDPLTLFIGESNETAALLGYRFFNDKLKLSYGVYDAKVKKMSGDSFFDDWFASLVFKSNDEFSLGVSYISNIASANDLSDELVERHKLDNLVAGLAFYSNYQISENLNLLLKYVSALRHFKEGELYTADDLKRRQPAAWDIEIQIPFFKEFLFAYKYAGSHDGSSVIPEVQYGPLFVWNFSKNLSLSFEYLRSSYAEGDSGIDNSFSFQLAIEY